MSPFDMFNLPVSFFIDLKILKERYVELQKKHHPDQLQNSYQKQESMHISSYINDAYRTLYDPARRIEALSAFIDIADMNLFLEDLMEWNENPKESKMILCEQAGEAFESKDHMRFSLLLYKIRSSFL